MIIKTHFKIKAKEDPGKGSARDPYHHILSERHHQLKRILGVRIFEIGKHETKEPDKDGNELHLFTLIALHPDQVKTISHTLKMMVALRPELKEFADQIFDEIISK